MMAPQFQTLFNEYAAELRDSKMAAEAWWDELHDQGRITLGRTPEQLWPMGPASHPWVIATYRKYFFLCLALNHRLDEQENPNAPRDALDENNWGSEGTEELTEQIEPKIFVLDLLSSESTRDLYDFLLALVLVPVGLKQGEFV